MQSFPELDSQLDQIAHFSTYAVSTRYPSDEPEPELDETRENVILATHFVTAISNLIDTIASA